MICPNCSVGYSDRTRTKARNQAISATTWTAQALWSGGDVDVYLQAVAGSPPTLKAFRVAFESDGSGVVVDVPAGAGLKLRSEARVYYVYAYEAVTLQALVEETR